MCAGPTTTPTMRGWGSTANRSPRGRTDKGRAPTAATSNGGISTRISTTARLIVVGLYTKPANDPGSGLAPLVTINLTLPDGRIIDKAYRASPEEFSASHDPCDVRIGSNRFVGDLRRYRITAGVEDVTVDIDLVGEVPPSAAEVRPYLFRHGQGPAGKVVRLAAGDAAGPRDHRLYGRRRRDDGDRCRLPRP